MGPLFQHGDSVVRRNRPDERGTVQGQAKNLAGRYFYKVLFDGTPIPVQVVEGDLRAVTLDLSVEARLLNGEFGDKSTFSRLLTYERLRSPLQDTLYSLRASRTEFQAYQFKPLLKFLRSAKHRLLLADEVGLGKTIEAGFILCELLARQPNTFRRALVVCKASLCIKWQMEMRRRFDLFFEIWKTEQLRNFLVQYREDAESGLRAICSLESFRNPALMQDWEAMPPPLDVLVIDEAHHLKNSETKAHKACRNAAESAEAVLALTATPIQMGSRDLFNLLSLLDEEEFSSFEYFEACMLFNRHVVQAEREVPQSDPGRFERIYDSLKRLGQGGHHLLMNSLSGVSVKSSIGDLAMAWNTVRVSLQKHPLFEETLRLLRTSDPTNQRATVEIQRNLAELNFLSRIFSRTRRKDVNLGTVRSATVIPIKMTDAERDLYWAVVDYVRARYKDAGKDAAILFGLMMPQRQLASCIPAMVDYYEAQVGSDAPAGGIDSEESDFEKNDWNSENASDSIGPPEELRKLIRRWYREGQPDSKFNALRQSLEHLQQAQPGEPIIIFSYFKKTLEYLSRRLGTLGYSNTVISGAFAPDEREKRIRDFREARYQILLSSEVGSEGLDFQFCHILFNYDLPWNPMVVEQRIGRLDRFGQAAEKILIFNLSAPGTIEDEILRRLYGRIKLFEAYIGDLEAILGGEMTSLTRDLFDPDISEEQRKQRIDQAGLLLEKRKLQFEEWERSSPQFIGHDEYYRQEVDRVQALGRFIKSEDLRVFLEDFLAHYDRKSELAEVGPRIYRLDSGEKLIQFVVNQPEDPQKITFLTRLHSGSVRLTFDSEVAERNRDLAFIHVRHFFIRAIVAEYERGEIAIHPVASIRIRPSEALPPGNYLYVLARATIRAAREQEILLPVLVDLQSLEPLPEDLGEISLGLMVREGEGAVQVQFDADSLRGAYARAECILAERFQSRREDVERLNQAFVDARLASVHESYRVKTARKADLLERARTKGQSIPYIRMLEGGLRNLAAEQRSREAEIERLRSVTAEHALIAAGLLQVC